MNERIERSEGMERNVIESIWWTFRLSFGLVPVVAGLDKFLNLLVYWPKYVAPSIAGMLPMTAQHFMYLAGIIEIVAGLAVLLSPWTKVFAYVVAAWLAGIALNLVIGGFYDIAVRDLVMAISAVSLARLTSVVRVGAAATQPVRQTAVGSA